MRNEDTNASQDMLHIKYQIDNFDLTPVIERLIKINKWKASLVPEAVKQYRNYLFLKKKYGVNLELPPSYDIDEVWHAHILHTENYSHFCQIIFGSYLHHHPHHGNSNNITNKQLEQLFENQTQTLYYRENKEYLTAIRPLSLKVKFLRLLNEFKVIFDNYKMKNRKKNV